MAALSIHPARSPMPFRLYAVILSFTAITELACAQFTTVINSPPTVLGAFHTISNNTQLNVHDGGLVADLVRAGSLLNSSNIEVNVFGGVIGSRFDANTGSEVNVFNGNVGILFRADGGTVNVSGGNIGDFFQVDRGSNVNVSGGRFGNSFEARTGTVNVSGGSFGDRFQIRAGSEVHLFGSEFRLNEVLIEGLESLGNEVSLSLPANATLSGLLSDGTPFAFSMEDGDSFAEDTITLHAATVAPINVTEIDLPNGPAPRGIRGGQTIAVNNNGVIGSHFNAGRGGTVIVNGGQIGKNFEAVGANVVMLDGAIETDFDAFAGSVVSIQGGLVGSSLTAFGHSSVNISGGTIGQYFDAFDGAEIVVSGGTLGDGFQARSGSEVAIVGGEFRRNGVAIEGLSSVGDSLQIEFSANDFLSGTLADGTPFAFSRRNALDDLDSFASGTLTLRVAELPAIDPQSINVPTDPAPLGIRQGQTLSIGEGGTLKNNFSAGVGSTVFINGGDIGQNFEAVDAIVNISGGTIGWGFDAFRESVVNITGGFIGSHLTADAGSEVNISGGVIGYFLTALSGSRINISGGNFDDTIYAQSGSRVTVSGSEFRLDGQLIAELGAIGSTITLNIPHDSILTCTLADGTPFIYSDQDDGFLWPGTLKLTSVQSPSLGPAIIRLPFDTAPSGIRDGQILFVEEGGVLNDNFKAGWGSSIVITGGYVGENFEAAGARVSISGGTIGPGFDAFHGSIVTISGGAIGDNLYVRKGSVVEVSGDAVLGYAAVDTGGLLNVSGGSINRHLRADQGSTINIAGGFVSDIAVNEDAMLNISGGTVDTFSAYEGARVNVSGGEVLEVQARPGSSINVYGTSFLLSGTDITASLVQNVPFLVVDGYVELSGRLADQSPFEFDLYVGILDAMLTITLVLPGDYNVDGVVDAADYVVWRGATGSIVASRGSGADGNFDGQVTQADHDVWRANFGRMISGNGSDKAVGSLVIPEPNSLNILLCVVTPLAVFGRRIVRRLLLATCHIIA